MQDGVIDIIGAGTSPFILVLYLCYLGFGRTGTSSLKAALEILGFPCYHMDELYVLSSRFVL